MVYLFNHDRYIAVSVSSVSTDNLSPTETENAPIPGMLSTFRQELKPHGMLWAQITLGVMLMATVFAYYTVWHANEKAAQNQFDIRVAQVADAIEKRMVAYNQVLHGGLGLLKASNTVSRAEWHEYVTALDLKTLFPGIQGLGYAEFVTPENRLAYEESIRQEGFEDFSIRPPGDREIYSSITFLEPFDLRNQQAFGYDMYSQVVRRDAMNQARDSGRAALSARVTLVQEILDDVQSGFLLYVPYYGHGLDPSTTEMRRQKIKGFVYSPFRMNDLMNGILGYGITDLHLSIFDGLSRDDEALMFSPRLANENHKARFEQETVFQFGQHEWTLVIASEPEFEAAHQSTEANMVLGAGLVTSLLVFGVLWSFSSTGRRAQILAERITKTLAARSHELERSNKELERFAYAASHDLKSPLRAIDNLAGFLEEDLEEVLTNETRGHLDKMRARIQRLDELLDGLLEYSRIGLSARDISLVDATALAQDVVDLMNPPAGFSIEVQPDLPEFFAARTPLSHVLQNLVSNAIKHHDRDSGYIKISGRDLGTHVSISVADDGPGIPEEFHERIFEMFQTLGTKNKPGSNGLGLSMVERYVYSNGGKIEVVSQSAQRGTTFRFTWRKSSAPKESGHGS